MQKTRISQGIVDESWTNRARIGRMRTPLEKPLRNAMECFAWAKMPTKNKLGDPLRAIFAWGAGATLQFMLPLFGLPRRPDIWYHILAQMGVTVLFVACAAHLLGKLRFSPVQQALLGRAECLAECAKTSPPVFPQKPKRRKGRTWV